MSWVTLAVLLVLGSYNWTPAGGQTCSLSGSYTCKVYCMQTILNLYVIFSTIEFYMHTAGQFLLSTVTASAESVDGPTPTARMTWSTTAPPECVTSVRVEFRTASYSGPVVANYTTNSTSETEFIQTGLRCSTYYYITVVVTGQRVNNLHPTLSGSTVRVLVGGNKIVSMKFSWCSSLMLVMPLCRFTYSIWSGNWSHCRQH